MPFMFRKLESMTAEEIQEAQERLRSSLSPQLLQFLQNRRKTSPQTALIKGSSEEAVNAFPKLEALPPVEGKICDKATAVRITEAIKPPDLLNQYPHMNRDEPEKREWMADVPDTEVAGKLAGGYAARFGFDGRLLDPAMKVNKLQFIVPLIIFFKCVSICELGRIQQVEGRGGGGG